MTAAGVGLFMFDIGWSELVVIGVVALIVIGPKELPAVLRTLGQWMGKIRRMASEFQGQFQEAMREAEMADLKKQADEIRRRPVTRLHRLRSDGRMREGDRGRDAVGERRRRRAADRRARRAGRHRAGRATAPRRSPRLPSTLGADARSAATAPETPQPPPHATAHRAEPRAGRAASEAGMTRRRRRRSRPPRRR